jgi:hypothetical protein
MSESQTIAIPIMKRVVVQQISNGVFLVATNDGAPSMATSAGQMHEKVNEAFGIVPAKRERKAK